VEINKSQLFFLLSIYYHRPSATRLRPPDESDTSDIDVNLSEKQERSDVRAYQVNFIILYIITAVTRWFVFLFAILLHSLDVVIGRKSIRGVV